MNFREFLNKHYFQEKKRSISRILFMLLFLSFIVLVFVGILLISLSRMIIDLEIKDQIDDYEHPHGYLVLDEFDVEDSSYNYIVQMKNKDVRVKKSYYIYWSISLLAFFFYFDFIVYLFSFYKKYRRSVL